LGAPAFPLLLIMTSWFFGGSSTKPTSPASATLTVVPFQLPTLHLQIARSLDYISKCQQAALAGETDTSPAVTQLTKQFETTVLDAGLKTDVPAYVKVLFQVAALSRRTSFATATERAEAERRDVALSKEYNDNLAKLQQRIKTTAASELQALSAHSVAQAKFIVDAHNEARTQGAAAA